jgi:hypothetical protein
MKTTPAGAGTVMAPVDDLEALQRQAADLARAANAATQTYERTAWICYAAIFLVIPLAVVIFRLHMQAWHYYLAGALFLAGALLSSAMDIVAMSRQDDADRAARRAHDASEDFRVSRRGAG